MSKEILRPIYCSQKSFYGKAVVFQDNSSIILYSYNTLVAKIDKLTGQAYVQKLYSRTTTKHIIEFLRQYYNSELQYNSKMLRKEFIIRNGEEVL